MDAVCHPETAAQRRVFQPKAAATPAPPPRGSILAGVKRQAMDAVSSVETVAQVGAVKLAGGVALYAAHIRQMDAQTRERQRTVRAPQPERLGRDL